MIYSYIVIIHFNEKQECKGYVRAKNQDAAKELIKGKHALTPDIRYQIFGPTRVVTKDILFHKKILERDVTLATAILKDIEDLGIN
jgi:hypothetical protein